MTSFQPNWVSRPGNTILDILRERNISTESFVEQMRQPAECIHRLIYGEDKITDVTASQLSKVLGASEQFWLNRQRQYQESITLFRDIDEDKWLRDIPYKELLSSGWIVETDDKLGACLKFFGVQSVEEWARTYDSEMSERVSFRTSPTFKSKLGSLACWLRQGEVVGNSINCKDWNPEGFRASLSHIRKLVREKNPVRFIPKLVSICAGFGVAVAVVRTPNGCRASGATKFMANGKALLILSFRHLTDDHFWFTFFHEAGHLLLHEGKGLFLEGLEQDAEPLEKNSSIQDQEDEANDFAGEILIPHHLRSRLGTLRGNTRDIIAFSMEAGVSSGIVIGQMQHYGFIKRSYLNGFKRRYNWNEISIACEIAYGTGLPFVTS